MIPVTVFAGFLGSGKTTIILSLIQRLPRDLKVVLLKNEFGDVKVDSGLARESNVQISEFLNGCICCVLVGQMKNALLEIKEQHSPDRIIIETSGSAFPAPIAWQIRQLADDGFTLDSIVTVIDCVNFIGYEDTSYTAKMQAQYTDIILLNKHELVSARDLDTVLDHVYLLNEDTPMVKCSGMTGVSPELVFGLDTKLFLNPADNAASGLNTDHHAMEVDLLQIMWPLLADVKPTCSEGCTVNHEHHHHHHHHHESSREVSPTLVKHTRETLEAFLGTLSKDSVYRVKGYIVLHGEEGGGNEDDGSVFIVNWAFGRNTLTGVTDTAALDLDNVKVKLTVMGVGLKMLIPAFARGFGVAPLFTPALNPEQ